MGLVWRKIFQYCASHDHGFPGSHERIRLIKKFKFFPPLVPGGFGRIGFLRKVLFTQFSMHSGTIFSWFFPSCSRRIFALFLRVFFLLVLEEFSHHLFCIFPSCSRRIFGLTLRVFFLLVLGEFSYHLFVYFSSLF